MANRYDPNPFAEEEEVNPFAVSFLTFDSLVKTRALIALQSKHLRIGFSNFGGLIESCKFLGFT